MQFVTTDDAPPAGGHYSQATVTNGFVFVAGQLPVLLEGGIHDGVEAQIRQAFSNAEVS
jgi:2-iminobutanoate/2-iminopropanoate deaminase